MFATGVVCDIIYSAQQKEGKMEGLKKLISTMVANLGITVVLIISVILFVIFSDGLLPGIIAALSALVAYTCCDMLYKEMKKTPVQKAKGKKK